MRQQQKSFIKSVVVAGTVLAAGVSANTANAATLSDLGLSEAMIRALAASLDPPAAVPAISFGSPIGFGAGWGQVFVGLAGQTLPDTSDDDIDGSAAIGMGFGEPIKYVGVEASVNIISLTGRGRNSGEDGSFNFKVHTALPMQSAVAIGVENVGQWGDAEECGESSVFAVGTKVFSLRAEDPTNSMPLSLNLGIGSERFNDIEATQPIFVNGRVNECGGSAVAESGANLFGGVAFAPIEMLSLIADYTGRDLNLGVSIVPARRIPLVISLGAINVTERYDEFGQELLFAGSVGYSFNF
jgi:hypothetical protein